MDHTNRQSPALDIQVKESVAVVSKAHDPSWRSNVRFGKDEWDQLQNDQTVTGRSIPELLKARYFKHPPLSTLMSPEGQKYMLTELRRIGNNFNQVAKILNSGFREGWNKPLLQIGADLAALRRYVANIYGDH